ncbi:hypothetical protein FS749_007341 [Ceratobasidium sp. UAMH 11750]|nr:hypothetical protein FS749_007341 [Ceratobasidium sp. UAMH 11750]
MRPTDVLRSWILSKSPRPLIVWTPSTRPPIPVLYPSSLPVSVFTPIQPTDHMNLATWVNDTQTVPCQFKKAPFLCSGLASYAYHAISDSLFGPPSPTPVDGTLGGSFSPTRTRTTTTDDPPLPKPASARFGNSPRPYRWYRSRWAISPRLARHLRTLYSSFVDAMRFPAVFVEAFLLMDRSSQIIWTCGLLLFTLLFALEVRQVHYHYTVIIEGYQFTSRRILNRERTWTAECPYSHRESMDWKAWDAIDRYIQCTRMRQARIRGLNLKVRVIRERTVRDWYFTVFGMRSVEVPEDPHHGIDVFETEDAFMLAAPDLDHDLELPKRGWDELERDWLLGEPPTPPASAPPTPSPPQRAFVRPVRIADPGDPPDTGGGQDMQ